MTARSRQNSHQFAGCFKKTPEPLCCVIDGKPSPQMGLLSRDTHGTVVRVTCPHAKTVECLHGRVRDGDSISTQRQGLGKVAVHAKPASDVQSDIAAASGIEVASGPFQSGDGGNRNVVAKQHGCSTGTAAATLEDDVVDADSQRRGDVVLDVLGRQLHTNRHAARLLANVDGDIASVPGVSPRTSTILP